MDYRQFYSTLFAPLTDTIGPIDKNTIFAIMGFDGGGPLNFSTIGVDSGITPITYVSCELAVRDSQIPTRRGGYRYELLASCDDEPWVRNVLSNLGRMSMDVAFDHGHTVDVVPGIGEEDRTGIKNTPQTQGVLLQQECTAEYNGTTYGILRCVGITRPEMEFSRGKGSAALVVKLRAAGVWPHTLIQRRSVV